MPAGNGIQCETAYAQPMGTADSSIISGECFAILNQQILVSEAGKRHGSRGHSAIRFITDTVIRLAPQAVHYDLFIHSMNWFIDPTAQGVAALQQPQVSSHRCRRLNPDVQRGAPLTASPRRPMMLAAAALLTMKSACTGSSEPATAAASFTMAPSAPSEASFASLSTGRDMLLILLPRSAGCRCAWPGALLGLPMRTPALLNLLLYAAGCARRWLPGLLPACPACEETALSWTGVSLGCTDCGAAADDAAAAASADAASSSAVTAVMRRQRDGRRSSCACMRTAHGHQHVICTELT